MEGQHDRDLDCYRCRSRYDLVHGEGLMINAFEQGYKDFAQGNTTNPYNKNTPKYRDWEFGFNKAYAANLSRVRDDEDRRRSQRVSSKEEA